MAVRTSSRKAAANGADGAIRLLRLSKNLISVDIEGVTPVICHRFSEKYRVELPGHPDKDKIKEQKGPKDPDAEAEAALYRLDVPVEGYPIGTPAFKATGFKAAMINAVGLFEGLTKVNTKIVLHVVGYGAEQLVPINCKLEMHEDICRISNGAPDLRYRYYLCDWSARITVQYVANVIDADSVVTLLDAAGMSGVGDWRPSAPKSNTGTYGQWRVVDSEPEQARVQ